MEITEQWETGRVRPLWMDDDVRLIVPATVMDQ